MLLFPDDDLLMALRMSRRIFGYGGDLTWLCVYSARRPISLFLQREDMAETNAGGRQREQGQGPVWAITGVHRLLTATTATVPDSLRISQCKLITEKLGLCQRMEISKLFFQWFSFWRVMLGAFLITAIINALNPPSPYAPRQAVAGCESSHLWPVLEPAERCVPPLHRLSIYWGQNYDCFTRVPLNTLSSEPPAPPTHLRNPRPNWRN